MENYLRTYEYNGEYFYLAPNPYQPCGNPRPHLHRQMIHHMHHMFCPNFVHGVQPILCPQCHTDNCPHLRGYSTA